MRCAEVAEHLAAKAVCLAGERSFLENEGHLVGYLMAANLLARVYPSIRLVGPEEAAAEASDLIRRISPECDITLGAASSGLPTLTWGRGSCAGGDVCVSASLWNVEVDSEVRDAPLPCAGPAAIVAAAVGAGELFRAVMTGVMEPARDAPTPCSWNVITQGTWDDSIPLIEPGVELGEMWLVGCGAIGQAFGATLAAARVRARVNVVDPESIELSNLQRYVLAVDEDEGAQKTGVMARSLRSDLLEVSEHPNHWEHRYDVRIETAVTALDSREARIGVQASLPRRVYNAYTQQADVAWSRHEAFGSDACLACLYWPKAKRSTWAEQVAFSLGEHPKRVAAYAVRGIPVSDPLPSEALQVEGLEQEQVTDWGQRSLLDDVSQRFAIVREDAAAWTGKTIVELYHDGLCGGALVKVVEGEHDRILDVPLAHESVLGGAMLCVTMLSGLVPSLKASRPAAPRFGITLRRGPQVPYGAMLAPVANCICQDEDFRQAYNALWT